MTRAELLAEIDDVAKLVDMSGPSTCNEVRFVELLPQIITALQDADRLGGENKRLQAEVERLTAQASACPWCRPVREIFTEAT